MPERATTKRAKEDLLEGKSPSDCRRRVRSRGDRACAGRGAWRKIAIAIGLSKCRRAGVPLKPPARGKTTEATRHRAEKDYEKGQVDPKTGPEGKIARGSSRWKTMQKEPKSSASHHALSEHAKHAANRRGKSSAG